MQLTKITMQGRWKPFSVGMADANKNDELTLSAQPGISRWSGGMPPKDTFGIPGCFLREYNAILRCLPVMPLGNTVPACSSYFVPTILLIVV